MNLDTEASAIVGTATAVVTALIALMVAFGLSISQEQQTAVLGVVAVGAPLVAALLIRSKVYSKATVKEITKTLGESPAVPTTTTGVK